jgi:CRISPR-associated protein Csb3
MAEASIPVDLFNPGQVFACLGFVEAADVLLGDAEGAFDWSDEGDVRFLIRARGDASPVVRVLEFLSRAEASGEAPEGSKSKDGWKADWGALRFIPRSDGYPFPDPLKPANVVCLLRDGPDYLRIAYWGEGTRIGRDNVKFWGGAGGYPGAALARDALELIREAAVGAARNPFELGRPQGSSFRLDWRRDYIPIDAGFSLNRHGDKIVTVGFPIVELLGAIGLSHARPRRMSRRDKLDYVYGVAARGQHPDSAWLPPALLRLALGGEALPFPTRHFRMLLGWPGQEGQARAITTVTEETRQ